MPVPAPVISFPAQAGPSSSRPETCSSSSMSSSSLNGAPLIPSSGPPPDLARHELRRMVLALEGDGRFKILPPIAYRRHPLHEELEWAFRETLRGQSSEQDLAAKLDAATRLEAAACGRGPTPEGGEFALDVLRQYNCEAVRRDLPPHPVARILAGMKPSGVEVESEHAVCQCQTPMEGWDELHLAGRRIALVVGHASTKLDPPGVFSSKPPVPPRFDNNPSSPLWYPFFMAQDAPRPDTVMASTGSSVTAKLDLFVAMRLALKQIAALHAQALAAFKDIGPTAQFAMEEPSERTLQVFGVLTYGKTWELHAMRQCGDNIIEVRLWEGAMDLAEDVVEFQSLLGHIVLGCDERARIIANWLDLKAQPFYAAQQANNGPKDEPMEDVEPISTGRRSAQSNHSHHSNHSNHSHHSSRSNHFNHSTPSTNTRHSTHSQ